MKLYSFKIVLVVFLIATSIKAQALKLDKVTVTELQAKKHSVDTSAAAAILYKKEELFLLITKRVGLL